MKVTSLDMQKNFGMYLKFVEANEEIIVTRDGKEIAKITPLQEPFSDCFMENLAVYKTDDWVTYEEFLELVEQSEQRHELIDGVVYDLASPSFKHQCIVQALLIEFHNWFKGKICTPIISPFDVTLLKQADNICVVQPDLLVICDQEKIDQKGKYNGTPTLVVEVLSPSTRSKDLLQKFDLYKLCGVKEYWIVDPMNEQVIIYSLADNEIIEHKSYHAAAHRFAESIHFAGLKVAIKELFEQD